MTARQDDGVDLAAPDDAAEVTAPEVEAPEEEPAPDEDVPEVEAPEEEPAPEVEAPEVEAPEEEPAPDEDVPEGEPVPEEPASEDQAPADVAPGEAASDEDAPDEDPVPEEPASEDRSPEDVAPGEAASEDVALEDEASEDMAPGAQAPEDVTSDQDSPADEEAPEDEVGEVGAEEAAEPQEAPEAAPEEPGAALEPAPSVDPDTPDVPVAPEAPVEAQEQVTQTEAATPAPATVPTPTHEPAAAPTRVSAFAVPVAFAPPSPDAPPPAVVPDAAPPSPPAPLPAAHAAPPAVPPTSTAAASEPPAGASPIDVFPAEETRRRWPRVLGGLLSVLVVLAGAYVGALWLLSDTVPTGTSVAGVEIGGLEADAAIAFLEESLAAATTEPVAVAAGEQRTSLDPVAAGLALDAQSTVDGLTGFGLEPSRLWRHIAGGGDVPPVTTVDQDALGVAVDQVAAALVVEPLDGTVVFVDGQPATTDAVDGVAVDEEASAALLADAWLTAARPIELPTAATTPAITQAEVQRVLTELARPLVGAPVSVSVAGQIAELPTGVLAATASFVPDGSELVLQMDGEQLVEEVMARTTGLLTPPADASFVFQDGAPVIVPGVPGTNLDPEALAEAVAEAGTGADRTAEVELVETDPAASTAELEALGITQIVSEFSTPLTSEPRRTSNIVNGAAKISGVLVRPGETFSLTEALGPIDAANGFVQAGAIINGEHQDAWGGGLSQISTTTYNAAFFAGFEDVDHTPHSEWFARYPEGREATIFTGSIDMKWKNTTPYGALVQSFVDGGRVHVRIWGTPYWTVETTTSARSGVVSPTTVYSQSPTCEPQGAGNPGFAVTVTRRLLLDGVEQDTQEWTTRYRPQNAIICGPAPATP